MSVIIGVDPHKGSHTAVAIGGDEVRLAKVKVRATRRQVDQLVLISARAPLVDRDDRDRRLPSSVSGGVSQAEVPSRLCR